MIENDPFGEGAVDDILAGIHNLINKREVVDAIDAPVDTRFVDEYREKSRKNFLVNFLAQYGKGIPSNTEPDELAPQLRKEFEDKKSIVARVKENSGALGEAQEIRSYTLEDLAKEASIIRRDLEGQLATFLSNSSTYRNIEIDIRRLDIIAMAADKAKNLPDISENGN